MNSTISITDLKQNTSSVVKKIKTSGKSIIVLQHSRPAAVLVEPEYYAILEDALESKIDREAVKERRKEKRVPLDRIEAQLSE